MKRRTLQNHGYRYHPECRLRRACALLLAGIVLLSTFNPKRCAAEAPLEKGAQASNRIVELLCQNEGRLARCAGQLASDCSLIVKPIAETCLASVPASKDSLLSDPFERCFWKAFTSKYGKGFDYSEECFRSTNKDANPLQPLPPELKGLMRPLNP